MSTMTPHPPVNPEPAWEIAQLFPNQGDWSEGEYLDLVHRTNHLLELIDGRIVVLDMPKRSHQRIVLFLRDVLLAFVGPRGLGEVLVAGYPVRLRPRKFREPDIVFLLAQNADRMGEDYAQGADLVMEVVSEDRRRDLEIKRAEYAEAGIPEYWIVDPREQRITVLRLAEGGYVTHGDFAPGDRAASALLPGFEVEVHQVFAAIKS